MRKFMLLLLTAIAVVSLFAVTTKSKQVLSADMQSRIILVAVLKDTDTSFKNALIDSLKSHYEPKYQVRKIVIRKAKDLNNQKYRLLIVMDQNKAGLAMNGATKSLMKLTSNNNAIFFMTSGDKKWQWKQKDVHHIASASEKTFFPKAWQELKIKADTLLK